MAIDPGEVRTILNDLIETCKDAQEGFREAAEKLKDSQIRSLLLKYSMQRSEFAGELQAEVTRMGGEPAKSGSTAGAIHRGWIGLKAAVTGDSPYSILEEAERGEDAAVKNYREALGKDLPSDIHDFVRAQLVDIQHVHNVVRQLRDGARKTTSTSGSGQTL